MKGGVIAGVIVVILALTGLLALITLPGRLANRTLDTTNVVASYERFFDLEQNWRARLAQIRDTARQLQAETDPAERARLRTDLGAVRQSCRELSASYNADSAKVTTGTFRARGLPATLDPQACEAQETP